MKTKITSFALAGALSLGVSCADTKTSNNEDTAIMNSTNILVVYYSHSGNTKAIAEMIKEETGGALFSIETVNTYPSEYRKHTEQAKKELNDGYLPPLKNTCENIGNYDIVFVGSPSWWGTIAPPVATFLSTHDMSGKTVIPFVTHLGSGMGRNAQDIAKHVPNAIMKTGKAFRGNDVNRAKDDVKKWIAELGLNKENETK